MSIPSDKHYYHSDGILDFTNICEASPSFVHFRITYISRITYILALITNVNWSIKCFTVLILIHEVPNEIFMYPGFFINQSLINLIPKWVAKQEILETQYSAKIQSLESNINHYQ